LFMDNFPRSGQAVPSGQEYRALLAVSEAIVSHPDLQALFHDLTGRLQQVVRFAYLILVLHDTPTHTEHPHVLATSDPAPLQASTARPVGGGPAGWVWQNQQPLIISNLAEDTRWPRFLETVKLPIGSLCDLPLTTARKRLGALAFVSRQVAA